MEAGSTVAIFGLGTVGLAVCITCILIFHRILTCFLCKKVFIWNHKESRLFSSYVKPIFKQVQNIIKTQMAFIFEEKHGSRPYFIDKSSYPVSSFYMKIKTVSLLKTVEPDLSKR